MYTKSTQHELAYQKLLHVLFAAQAERTMMILPADIFVYILLPRSLLSPSSWIIVHP